MYIICSDCGRSFSLKNTDGIKYCPYCGSSDYSIKVNNADAYIKDAIPRMRELVNEISEHNDRLSVLRKEYRRLYHTISVYKYRGKLPADVEIPAIRQSKVNHKRKDDDNGDQTMD